MKKTLPDGTVIEVDDRLPEDIEWREQLKREHRDKLRYLNRNFRLNKK